MTNPTDEAVERLKNAKTHTYQSGETWVEVRVEDLSWIVTERTRHIAALEAYEAAKDRIGADSYDGVDDRSRDLLETASQLTRAALNGDAG